LMARLTGKLKIPISMSMTLKLKKTNYVALFTRK
jgi:hypothetical protein